MRKDVFIDVCTSVSFRVGSLRHKAMDSVGPPLLRHSAHAALAHASRADWPGETLLIKAGAVYQELLHCMIRSLTSSSLQRSALGLSFHFCTQPIDANLQLFLIEDRSLLSS